MLRVTVDAFSGVSNPQWVLEESETNEILRNITRHRDAIADVGAGFDGLGFRGVILEPLGDDESQTYDVPAMFKIGVGSGNDGAGLEIAERLIRSMPKQASSNVLSAPADFDAKLVKYLMSLLEASVARPVETEPDGLASVAMLPADATCCYIERTRFNPDFWNRPDVQPYNNCYNYASNRRTDSFAQPGKGASAMYTALTCAEVTRAALADGCHRRFDCFPDSEKNRYLVALVINPGRDYHWYRQHTLAEGFWGHKPGSARARNTDNSSRVITNPETCDRGGYTEFCGYFYTCKTQANRIR